MSNKRESCLHFEQRCKVWVLGAAPEGSSRSPPPRCSRNRSREEATDCGAKFVRRGFPSAAPPGLCFIDEQQPRRFGCKNSQRKEEEEEEAKRRRRRWKQTNTFVTCWIICRHTEVEKKEERKKRERERKCDDSEVATLLSCWLLVECAHTHRKDSVCVRVCSGTGRSENTHSFHCLFYFAVHIEFLPFMGSS